VATVLIVDDTRFFRRMLSSVLRRAGHEVVGEADDGQEALELYEDLHPDVVVMDLVMPRTSGFEATRELASRHPGARVIVCSALTDSRSVQQAMQAGAADFVVKPLDPGRMLAAIERIVSGRGADKRRPMQEGAGTQCQEGDER